MANKLSAKNAVILIKGYNFSTYASSFETEQNVNPIDVTGFGDGCKNSIPGAVSASIRADMFWDSTANSVNAALYAPTTTTGHVTIIPEGYVLGNRTLSLPFMSAKYAPKGDPNSAITVGGLEFLSYGANEGIEHGYALAHATVTGTTTGTGFQVNAAPVTARCAGTIHVWTPTTSDTYVVTIEHSTALGSGYATLVTFTVDGKTRTSQRVAVASGTINQYLRVVATKTGASQPFGYSVSYWQSV